MALDLQSIDHAEDEYIDMEVSSYSNFFCNSISSPREFEFQMASAIPRQTDQPMTTSPADELFYKGKLLPLHLPPRLQMVEKLLQNSRNDISNSFHLFRNDNEAEAEAETETLNEFYSTPLATTTAPTPTATSTPFESCNISPSESFRISRELNPDEYMNEYYSTTEFSGFIKNDDNPKKSWSKKLKQSSIGSKLKASKAYLKSLFGKSGCSDESSTAARKVADEGSALKSQKNPFGQSQKEKPQMSSSAMARSLKKEKMMEVNTEVEGGGCNRTSFSLALRRHSTNKYCSSNSSSSSSSSGSSSSSLSCSNNSNGVKNHQLKYLKRCGSANYSEIENSIQGAIAHCKQSQQLFRSIKAASASRIGVREEQERPEELCRG